MLSFDVTWQNKNVLSALSRDLQAPNFAQWWLLTTKSHELSSCDHLMSRDKLEALFSNKFGGEVTKGHANIFSNGD